LASSNSPDSTDNGDARVCQYESQGQKYIVGVYTNNTEQSEFQTDSAKAAAEGHYAPLSVVAAPAYKFKYMRRLVVWKSRISITIDLGDTTFNSTPEALDTAREQIAAIALSRAH
jgi:hypothetical protein